MSDNSAIQWTDATWNPTTGCTKVSPGCANCYIERTPAFRINGRKFVKGATDLQLHENRLDQPLRWRKPRRVFVNSLSDLFHPGVPDALIDRVFAVMALAPQHTFQVLTKRPDRMQAYLTETTIDGRVTSMRVGLQGLGVCLDAGPDTGLGSGVQLRSQKGHVGELVAWPLPNVWLGVSVENQRFADERIPLLLQTPAAVRFISAEPLLESVDIGLDAATCSCCPRWPSRWVDVRRRVTADFPMALLPEWSGRSVAHGIQRATSNQHGALAVDGIGLRPDEFKSLPGLDWVIVGGESGPHSRPFDVRWARSIVQQCRSAGVPCFVKQLGAHIRGSGVGFIKDRYEMPNGDWRQLPIIVRPGAEAWVAETTERAIGFSLFDKKGGNPKEWPCDLNVRQFPEARI